jgi:hypothetical protein
MKDTEGRIQRLLAQKYTAPEWAYFSGVPNCTGGAVDRIADGVAMNLYPSKGLKLTCFEIKVSRSDLMAELKHITKSECVGKFCDYFVLVIPKGIVLAKELPDHWGLMEVDGEALWMRRKPQKQENVAPLTRGFVASLLRRASEKSEESKMVMELSIKEQAINAKMKNYEQNVNDLRKSLEDQEKELVRRIKDFEEREKMFQEATGLFPQQYYGKDRNHLIPAFLKAASKESMFQNLALTYFRLGDLQTVLGKIVEEFRKIETEET